MAYYHYGKKEFMSYAKKQNKHILVVHGLLQKENLASKNIVFKKVLSLVNYINTLYIATPKRFP